MNKEEKFWVLNYLLFEKSTKIFNKNGTILMALLDKENEFDSYKEIKKQCNISYPTIENCILELEKRGIIKIEKYGVSIKISFSDKLLKNANNWRDKEIGELSADEQNS